MKIEYVGKAGRRIVEGHEWNRDNGYVVDVDDQRLVGILLSHPPGDFRAVREESLTALHGIGEQRAAALAQAGVATLAYLAALSAERVAQIADQTTFGEEQIMGWVAEARSIIDGSDQQQVERPARSG